MEGQKKAVLFVLACTLVFLCFHVYNHSDVLKTYRPSIQAFSLSSLYSKVNGDHFDTMEKQQQPSVIDLMCGGKKPGKRILIAAKARTGSTFIGQFFNQNPNILYLFEPLRVIPDMVKRDAVSEIYRSPMGAELVRNLCNCDFLTYYAYQIQRWGLAVFESRALQIICDSRRKCPDVDVQYLKEKCHSYDTMVFKSIRVDDISSMFPLLKDPCFDLNVVFLVRDPRAVASSRKHFKFHTRSYKSLLSLKLVKEAGDTTTELHPANIHDYCKWLSRNVAMIIGAPKWAKEKITVLRYEDVVTNVTQKAFDIYNYFGLKMTGEVTHWIDENTHVRDKQAKDARGSMDTKRNSSSAAQAWRSDLRIDDVMLVQDACGRVMEQLDYKVIDSEDELTDLSTSLTKPLSLNTMR
ncbi:carbohydrate sulfotransferase 1-like [Glandiceps talaboti]